MKKVLIISEASVYLDEDNFICKSGGASCVHKIALSLKKQGFEPSVFALKEYLEQKEFEEISEIKYFRNFSSDRSSFRLIKYLVLSYKFAKNYDFVLVNQFLPFLLLPFLRRKKIALIHDVYLSQKSFWFKQFGFFKGSIGFVLEFLGLLFARIFSNKIIVVSKSTEEKFLKLVGRKASLKTYLIANSIDLKSYYLLPKEKFLLFVGRFVAYKRPKDLLFVLKKVNEKYPEFSAKFVMTRDFPLIYKEVLAYADEINVRNFELIKTVSDEKLKELFAKAFVLVHPSVIEGQGIVILEALASGTPVSAYNLKAYEGMLFNGENSELAKPLNKEELGLNTIKIIDNYKFYQKNSKKYLDIFSNENFDNKIKDLFLE